MLRGMGASFTPMVVSIIGVCGFRMVWIWTVFARHRELRTLYISYPISWSATAFIHLMTFLVLFSRLQRKNANPVMAERPVEEQLAQVEQVGQMEQAEQTEQAG